MIGRERTGQMIQPQANPILLLEEWSAVLTTRSGIRLYVRPVTSDDAALVDRFFAGLSHDDLRFRFLTPLAHPSLPLLEALVLVDHVRTEDFLVFTKVDGEMQLIATAMLAADPTMERAEVAIAVQPQYKQRGIGWTLLDFVAQDAKARGIRTLESIECRDNRAAIEVEQELGFIAMPCPGEPGLTLLSRTLAGPAPARSA